MKRLTLVLLALGISILSYPQAFSNLISSHEKDLSPENYSIKQWGVFADIGANTYWSDLTYGNIATRMSPQFNIGIDYWINSQLGLKVQYTGFLSRANKYCPGIFTRQSEICIDKNGIPYWKERNHWWDLGIAFELNLPRMIGFNESSRFLRKNDVLLTLGIGATHHFGLLFGSANEWSIRVEAQYSHYFSACRRWSLDIKLRALLYETHYDGIINHQKLDANIALCLGTTFSFVKNRKENNKFSVIPKLPRNQRIKNYQQSNSQKKPLMQAENPIKETKTIMPEDITFAVDFKGDRFEIGRAEAEAIWKIAKVIQEDTMRRFVIRGYADSDKDLLTRKNWLSMQRAKNVYNYLIEVCGIDQAQLIIDEDCEGYYKKYPNNFRKVTISHIIQ